jgi:hypothetical protein
MTVAQSVQKAVEQLSEDEQRDVLEFAEWLRRANESEDQIGKAGAKLTGKVWPAEDFSDWEEPSDE